MNNIRRSNAARREIATVDIAIRFTRKASHGKSLTFISEIESNVLELHCEAVA